MPARRFDRKPEPVQGLALPAGTTAAGALDRVLRLPGVGSKRFLTTKVDRSVTGLIAQQQCCGPLQLPVADVAVMAQSHFGHTGSATSIGEQPLKVGWMNAGWRNVQQCLPLPHPAPIPNKLLSDCDAQRCPLWRFPLHLSSFCLHLPHIPSFHPAPAPVCCRA